MKFNVNGQEYIFGDKDLPMLIHGKEGSGASYFTISLIVHLCRLNKTVVVLSGFSQAREEYVRQTHDNDYSYFFIRSEIDRYVNILRHHKDYIYVIKNIELFEESIYNETIKANNFIISGDIESSSFNNKLTNFRYSSKIYFSLITSFPQLPDLPKYYGYFDGSQKGLIHIIK